ncbi:hypothetical protein [Streptomyces jeddahensis]|uniref:Uncharacterized protein n=1 Tax=Streptomyces jeddahensis TaxID=1716141 RepID=A0A177HJ71_9ACTN|nr:hypothetical protein [Streptomyces jeddahensis]OAH10457.1 hypothetical protein STSP_61950 [Streptomyces jeddahensis]
MPDSPSEPATRPGQGPGPWPGTPRWVKVSGGVAIALIVLVVVLHLTGSGFGPGVHSGGGH